MKFIVLFGICASLVADVLSASKEKRILLDDQNYVQSQIHQLTTDIQDLKTKLAEKDIHLVQMQNVVHGLADRLTQKDQQVSIKCMLNETFNQNISKSL